MAHAHAWHRLAVQPAMERLQAAGAVTTDNVQCVCSTALANVSRASASQQPQQSEQPVRSCSWANDCTPPATSRWMSRSVTALQLQTYMARIKPQMRMIVNTHLEVCVAAACLRRTRPGSTARQGRAPAVPTRCAVSSPSCAPGGAGSRARMRRLAKTVIASVGKVPWHVLVPARPFVAAVKPARGRLADRRRAPRYAVAACPVPH